MLMTPTKGLMANVEVDVNYDNNLQRHYVRLTLKSCNSQDMHKTDLNQYFSVPGVQRLSMEHKWGRTVELRGDLKAREQYKVQVQMSVCKKSGVVQADFQTPAYPPAVTFLSKGLYFSQRNPHLRFQHRELKENTWKVYRIDPLNRYLLATREGIDLTKMESNGVNDSTDRDVRSMHYIKDYPGEIFTLQTNLPKVEEWQVASIDLSPYYKKGDWLVIESPTGANKVVQFTELGLYLRKNAQSLWGQVLQLDNGEPKRAQVNFKRTNGEVIHSVSTDQAGFFFWEFSPKHDETLFEELKVVEAVDGEDSVQIFMDQGSISLNSLPISGVDTQSSPIQAFVYSDRGVYRLGDEVRLTVLLREWDLSFPREVNSVGMTLFGPSGKVLHTPLQGFAAQNGGVDYKWQVPHSAQTGAYRAEIEYNGKAVGLGKFSVEQIIPPSIEGELRSKVEQVRWNPLANRIQTIQGEAQARFLFGAPAANKRWEYRCILQSRQFQPDQWQEFVFEDKLKTFPAMTFHQMEDQQLNAEGQGSWECLDEGVFSREQVLDKMPGLAEVNVVANVFEEGGRSIRVNQKVPVYLHKAYPGVKKNFEGNLDYGEQASFSIMALDPVSGKPQPGVKLLVELLEKDYWGWYYFHNWDDPVVDSELTRNIKSSQVITSSSEPMVYNIKPSGCCEFELRVTVQGTGQSARVAFQNGWWSETAGMSSGISQKITFTPDKAKYQLGDTAHILINAPFDGELLLLQEKDGRSMKLARLSLQDRQAKFDLPLNDQHVPWFRLTGILLRAPEAEAVFNVKRETPYRALGMLPIQVENPREKLSFALDLPAEARPQQSFDLNLQAQDEHGQALEETVHLTVSVVDEGILNLINFKTPDPYQGFHRRPAYATEWYDTLGKVIPYSLHAGESAFGGDQNLSQVMKQIERVKPMAWWSGVVKTDEKGMLKLKVPVNDYTGRVRVMVVGWQNQRTGSTEAQLPVKAPVDLITSLPRVFGAYDRSQAVAEVFNNSKRTQEIEVRLEVEGLLLPTDHKPKQVVTVQPTRSETLRWNLEGMGVPGKATVRFIAKNQDGDTRTRSTDLLIRPVGSPQSISTSFYLKPGESFEETLADSSAFLENTAEWEVKLSSSPVVQLERHLKRLVSYPYGCAEQTTSRLLAMTLLKPTLGEAALSKMLGDEAQEIDGFIKEGIKKLEKMQMSDGGFAYWMGGSYQYEWINAYVSHFLYVANHQGYDVPGDMYSKSLNKMRTQALNSNPRHVDAVAYSAWVRSLNGQMSKSDFQTVVKNLRKVRMEQNDVRKGLATMWLQGAALRANLTLPASLLDAVPVYALDGPRDRWWRYHHFVSNEAAFASSLYNKALVGQVDSLKQATLFISHLNQRPYVSTHTMAWSLLALNAMFPAADSPTQVKVTTPANASETLSTELNSNQFSQPLNQNGAQVKLANISHEGNVFGNLSVKGWPAEPPRNSEFNQIQVKRYYLNEQGQLLNPPYRAMQGERLYVVLTIKHDVNQVKELANVALEDWLPAGLELENRRLMGDAQLPELPKDVVNVKPLSTDHIDYQDDKIAVFGTIDREWRSYVYSVRAVSQGEFRMMPLNAEAMYIPEFNAMYVEDTTFSVQAP